MCNTNAVVDFIEKHEDSFDEFIINVEFSDSSYFPEFVVEVVNADDGITSMTKREAYNQLNDEWFFQGDVDCLNLLHIFNLILTLAHLFSEILFVAYFFQLMSLISV